MKIVLAGPPRTGKSCLREHLKRAITARAPRGPYPYIITANPDGEGSWFQEAASRDMRAAQENRSVTKKPFDDNFARRVAREVRDCREELVLVDIGGLISQENRQICRSASHIVIVYANDDDLAPWREFAQELDLEVVAELRSAYPAAEDQVVDEGPPLVGIVHRLERGELDEPHPAIDALASTILALTIAAPEHPTRLRDRRTYRIERMGSILKVGLGEPGLSHELVRDAQEILAEMDARGELAGGGLLGVNGVCTVGVSAVLAHYLAHRFAAVALFDPKLSTYTVVVSHDPELRVGDVLPYGALT